MPGAVDPTEKLKSWVWEVSEMTVSDFRLCHFCAAVSSLGKIHSVTRPRRTFMQR